MQQDTNTNENSTKSNGNRTNGNGNPTNGNGNSTNGNGIRTNANGNLPNNNGGARKRLHPSVKNENDGKSPVLRNAIQIQSEPRENATRTSMVQCGKSSGDFLKKFRSPFYQRGCSKQCTGYTEESSLKLTVCTNSKKSKLSHRLKRSKKKIRQISDQVKIRTKKSMKKLREMYDNIGAKRAVGFDCDLRTCPSTLVACSASACAHPNMLFSKTCATNRELMIMKDQSVGTSVDKETST